MAEQPKPKMRRGLRALLIGSVTLNVLIIGVVAGAAISFRGDGPPTPIADRFGSPHIKALSHDDKRAVGKAIRAAYRKADVDQRGDRKHYQQTLAILRTAPLDHAALKDLVYSLDTASELRRSMARDVFIAQIVSMSDAERAAYADRLEEVLKRGPRDKDRKDKDGKPRPPKQP